MKAIRVEACGGPEVMHLCELPELQPGPGEVVVTLKAVGVNPVDTYLRSGAQGYAPTLPYTPGQDGAGLVAMTGPGVTDLKAGARVYVAGSLSGTYAETCLCKQEQVFVLPDRFTFAEGAAIGIPYATAFRALQQRALVSPEDHVLIHGASGSVGLAALQLCAHWGIKTAATAGTEAGRRQVAQAGASCVADHNVSDYGEQLLRNTGGRGYDVILEMLANVNLGRDLQLLAPSGRIVIIGSRGTIEINPREAMAKDAALLGMSMLNVGLSERGKIHKALATIFGQSSARPAVGLELPLSDAAKAHTTIIEGHALGKIVLVP